MSSLTSLTSLGVLLGVCRCVSYVYVVLSMLGFGCVNYSSFTLFTLFTSLFLGGVSVASLSSFAFVVGRLFHM